MANITTPPLYGVLRVSCWPHIGRSTYLILVIAHIFSLYVSFDVSGRHPWQDDFQRIWRPESRKWFYNIQYSMVWSWTWYLLWHQVSTIFVFDSFRSKDNIDWSCLRFAELAQVYAQQKNCKLLVYPGAFNMTTGTQHPPPHHWPGYAQVQLTGSCCHGPELWIIKCM